MKWLKWRRVKLPKPNSARSGPIRVTVNVPCSCGAPMKVLNDLPGSFTMVCSKCLQPKCTCSVANI